MTFINNPSIDINDHFISAGVNDRIMNSWSMGVSNTVTSSSNAFTINEGPIFLDVVSVNGSSKSETNGDSMSSIELLLSAVTNKGHLNLYRHQINNKVKKPIKAKQQLQIESHEGAPLKIYAAFLVNSFNERLDAFESDSELSFYFVYGSIVNPVIEKIVHNFEIFLFLFNINLN